MVSWLVKIDKDWMVIKRETPREGTGYNSAGGGWGGGEEAILTSAPDIVFVRFTELS